MKRPVLIAGYGTLAVVFAWLASVFILHRPVGETPASITVETVTKEPKPVRVEARWLLAGEVFWGRQMERIALAQPEPYEYLFSQLSSLNREQYDAWLAQLECPVTDANISFETQATSLIFNCRPEYLEEFEEWFTAVSLANNHMDNVN